MSPPTIYYLMGIDPRSEVVDAQGRPIMISSGQPIMDVVAQPLSPGVK